MPTGIGLPLIYREIEIENRINTMREYKDKIFIKRLVLRFLGKNIDYVEVGIRECFTCIYQ